MTINIRPMTQAERLYCYSWSFPLMATAGCIGHLRGGMGSGGDEFHTLWNDYCPEFKSRVFKEELEDVVNALRSDPAYGGIFASRGKLAAYCYAHPDSLIPPDGHEYGFRADTKNYSYMLRLNPDRGEHSLYIYCYVRELLDCHLAEAGRGIRFVTSKYQDLFRLADGDSIRIIKPDGEYTDRTCRYIRETHMVCGRKLYHIHDFAEEMERAGNTVIPIRSSLPEKCFAALETTGEVIVIHRGAKGYTPTGQHPEGVSGQEGADKLNGQIGVTKAQAAAMLAGSMFGWACPGADPANYDGQGKPVKNRP